MAYSQPFVGQYIPGKMEKSYPTPAQDTQLLAILESNITDYINQLYGSPPPKDTNPDKMLVNETPIDWKTVKRLYASDRVNQDTYNASISYTSESNSAPVFTRDYIVRRANYAPRTKGSTLSGIVNAFVTAPGSGYTQATVSVSLSGGTGSGGAITAIVSAGFIQHLVITSEGNYTVAPTITINDSGSGTGATGTAVVQPQTAVLVKDDMIRMTDQPLDGLYVLVRRVYKTLPGPTLTDYDQDPQLLSLITTTMREVANPVSAPTPTPGQIVHYKPIDSTTSIEIIQTFATPADYSTQRFAAWSFPGLFYGFFNNAACGTMLYQRGAFSAMVKIRLDHSFGSFTPVSGLTLIPNTFAIGSFRVGPVLNNAFTLESDNPSCLFSFDILASSPSVDTYNGYGSTAQLVSGESEIWKAQIFETVKMYVVMI